jgi:hypothetical protein
MSMNRSEMRLIINAAYNPENQTELYHQDPLSFGDPAWQILPGRSDLQAITVLPE